MATPNSNAPVGSGGRFAAIAASAGGGDKGDRIAAAIGRKKYGAEGMAKMAAAGRKGMAGGGKVKFGGLPGMEKPPKGDNPNDTPAQEAAERKRGIKT